MIFTGKLKRRVSQLVLLFTSAFSIAGVQAQTIISEVLYDASSTDNGNVFVELFGTPGTLLDGLLLEGVNGSDGRVYRSVLLAGTIPLDGVFVVADDSGDGTSLVGSADLIREVDFQNGPDSIVLRDGSLILDALGYGDFSGGVFAGEGSAAMDVVAGRRGDDGGGARQPRSCQQPREARSRRSRRSNDGRGSRRNDHRGDEARPLR